MTKKNLELVTEETAKRVSSIEVLFKDGIELAYEDIIGYQVGGGALAISLKSGETLVWPFDDISFIKHTVQE